MKRRDLFKATLASAAVAPFASQAHNTPSAKLPKPARGIEMQRKSDLGDGRYVNPIVAGDHADPTVLKDGDDYYMSFSSFDYCPGVVIWHSRDLVNWAPICAALNKPIGPVWATDLVKHKGRYYIYMPVGGEVNGVILVIHADNIRGPWSDPVNLNISDCIDPGHAVGEDGKRYLFFNGVRRIALTDDGLSTAGPLEKVYEPWRYPDDWVVEWFAPEGPKIVRHGEWFYMILAVGGTAGPPTSHMVIAARSRSIHGPWENCPKNPLVHTADASEPWWSRGHASLVEGPAGDWWMIYHGYENGYRTLGRQTLMEPIEWTSDGWFRTLGGTLNTALPKPRGGRPSASGIALSDDFSTNKLGVQWSFYAAKADEIKRITYQDKALQLRARGTSLADTSPLLTNVGDRDYEASVVLDIDDGAQGGLTLFYSRRAFCGLGFDGREIILYHYGAEMDGMRRKFEARTVHIRVTNRNQVATFHYSADGKNWIKHHWQSEVSGFNHNAFNDFLSLRVGIFSTGKGAVRARNFTYRAL